MARQKGSANFAGTLEVLAGGPLDARSQVPTKADLTVASNFPYPYVGMQVYVIAEGKRYTLKAADVTVLANWEVEGGETGGGHTIEDPEGTALTQRDTLQFGGDLEVSDDDENEKTVVAPHELTTAELIEIMSTLPGGHGNDGNPVGTIISFMGVTAPYGYLICDGSSKNIADYSRLADLFESQFGSSNFFGGDGTTTFAVPDLRGEFLRGTGTNSHANQGSGAAVGVHQDGTAIPFGYSNANAVACSAYTNLSNEDVKKSNIGRTYTSASTIQDNNGEVITSRPTNTSVLYCIKY